MYTVPLNGDFDSAVRLHAAEFWDNMGQFGTLWDGMGRKFVL